MIERRFAPLHLALMSLGVLPTVVPYPRREVFPAELQQRPRLAPDALEQHPAFQAVAAEPKRERYEMRPLAERKARRAKRKQRRNR